jgi:hypothetical protein
MLVRGGSPLASCDGMGYEMVGLRFELQKKKYKTQAPFCATHMIGMGRIKRELRFVLGFVAVRTT